ncbi:DUF2163 domain-containing protein [Croceicoccus bisphenolivorans]|uniref:DUF2163 domain-containing protein n=1 Tax=Croceicoccus bisphenolivorans TaxID=1783232 RepID=UPI00082B9834|nr:DUF2163 domain-containing protein [Croceicoccus bisphenolivorans]
MTRRWFSTELESVATWWRVFRQDGVTVGFTSHDRDLVFDHIRHLTAPGMVPSAVRLSSDLEPDSAEITGALDHETINAADLAMGRFDGARVEMGLVDWTTMESRIIYAGTIGSVSQDGPTYSADLSSVKSVLARQRIPQTSPTCRAHFCGPGCNLSIARFTREAIVDAVYLAENALAVSGLIDVSKFLGGSVIFLDGQEAGIEMSVAAIDGGKLVLNRIFDTSVAVGHRIELREGCDHRWFTCSDRFANAVNFRGEPFLPGNDLLARYPMAH